MPPFFFARFFLGLLLSCCCLVGCQQPSTALATKQTQSNGYTLQSGSLQLLVDTLLGGRIASFTYEDREVLLTARDTSHSEWGSTVWLSSLAEPAAAKAIFDQRPYTVTAKEAQKITLMSDVDPDNGLQIVKNIRLAEDERWGHVATMRYRVYNRGSVPQSVYLLENTRIPYEGKIEWAKGGHLSWLGNIPPLIDSSEEVLQLSLTNQQPNGQQLFYQPSQADETYFKQSYRHAGLIFSKSWRIAPTTDDENTSPYGKTTPPSAAPLMIKLEQPRQLAELQIASERVTLAPEEYVELTTFWTLRPE